MSLVSFSHHYILICEVQRFFVSSMGSAVGFGFTVNVWRISRQNWRITSDESISHQNWRIFGISFVLQS